VKYIPVEYPPTEEIMAEIMKLGEQATKKLLELKEMLKK
jgi:type I restriction enzyme M protein